MNLDLTQVDATLRANPPDDPLEGAIQTRLADLETGKYHRNTAFVLRQFAEFLRRHDRIGVERIEDITAHTLRIYARALKRAVDQRDIVASTAEQYWALVSSFLGWCVREGLCESNPALLNEAQEPLPEGDGAVETQFWTTRERTAICATVDQHVDDLLGSNCAAQEQLTAFRDRALVYTLSYTGCRGAELAAVPEDEKRNGLRWDDVDLEEGLVEVYGKTRKRQIAPILEPAVGPLKRWNDILEPSDDWPVFPTGHLPSLYELIGEETDADHERIWRQLQEENTTPPSMSTRSVRRILRQFCEQSPYSFEEPLKPHGARRGLGDELYQEDAELAQETLRHKNIETTHASYRDEQTRQVKRRADEIIE